MMKYLSLIAIIVLMASYAMASAPVYTGVPDVKLFDGRQLSSAFDLEAYNTSDPTVTFSVITGSSYAFITTTSYAGYYATIQASSTLANVTFQGDNAGGSGFASQLVKYSTYLVNKLGRIALGATDSQTIDIRSS